MPWVEVKSVTTVVLCSLCCCVRYFAYNVVCVVPSHRGRDVNYGRSGFSFRGVILHVAVLLSCHVFVVLFRAVYMSL
jgi:hypothetical protein